MQPVIGIIGGKGRMGKLFASFFIERGIKILVSDIGTKLTSKQLAEKSDITIVSVPIEHTQKVITDVLASIPKGAAIMDFTSVKTPAVKAMLRGKCEVMGIHPMFGNSNPIPGQTVILCPTRKSGKWSKWMKKFLLSNEVKIEEMTPKEHDKTMSLAQALIHFADITFADGLRRTGVKVDDLLKFTGKASELKVQLAARLLEQDEGLYGNMQIQNPYTLKAIKQMKKAVDEYIRIAEKKDIKAFKKLFIKDRTYMGKYGAKAYQESSHLIDRLMEYQSKDKVSKPIKPKKTDLAVLGPKNTYTDIAAKKYNPDLGGKYYCNNIEEVFDLVASGEVSEGIIPIENKIHGTVRETLDSLFKKNVYITQEIEIPINHSLIVRTSSSAAKIKTIISHPQALAQCRRHLKSKFPNADLSTSASTAAAAEKLINSHDDSLAVIAPEIVATHPGVKTLATHIEDEQDNSTSFVVIKKGKNREQKNSTKTSIAFNFDADSPGSLSAVFKLFADAKINMTRIESRPTKTKFGNYIFYLDFEASMADPKIKKLVTKITKIVAKLKLLGSYS
jgi:prephenate dehydratase/prephenate dehydrogenase